MKSVDSLLANMQNKVNRLITRKLLVGKTLVKLPCFTHKNSDIETGRRLFFVTGRSKSGNTWMGRVLNSHPELFCDLTENHAFHQDRRFIFFEKEPVLLHDQAKEFFDKRTHDLIVKGLIYNLILRCDKPGAKMLGDKSPRQDVKSILAALPKSKIIILQRDFRDMLVSLAFHVFRSTGSWKGCFEGPELKSLDNGFLKGHLLNYKRHNDVEVHKQLAGEKPDQVIIVRYEDMKSEPERTLMRALSHLGVDHSKESVNRCIQENSFEKVAGGRKPGEADSTCFFRKGIVGDWRNHFSPENISVFKEISGSSLIVAGYETDSNWTL